MAGYQINPATGELEPMPDTPQGNQQPTGYDAGDIARKLAAVLGGASAANRNQNNIVDSRNLDAWSRGEAARLGRDKFAVTAPGERLASSTRASLTSNFTPTKVSWNGPGSGLRGELPTISGGAAGGLANLDPRTKSLAGLNMDDLLAQQKKGGITGGGADAYMTPAPKMGQESLMDKLLGGGATAAGLMSALGGGKNGSSSDIPIQSIIDFFRHHGIGEGPNPFDTNDFGDWAANNDEFNPETHGGNNGLDPGQLPGYSGMPQSLPNNYGGGGYQSDNPDDWFW